MEKPKFVVWRKRNCDYCGSEFNTMHAEKYHCNRTDCKRKFSKKYYRMVVDERTNVS